MKFSAKGGGEDFKRAPAGNHIAICNMIVDMGLQPGSGMYPDPKYQVYIRWEIPAERVSYTKDGKDVEGPITIGRSYTASMGAKANLRKDLESWRAKSFTDEEASDFDIATILGKACMLTVVETDKAGKTYSNVKAIGALPKGMPVPKAENPLLLYDGEEHDDRSILPEWLQKKISEQLQPTTETDKDEEAMRQHQALHGDDDDILPF